MAKVEILKDLDFDANSATRHSTSGVGKLTTGHNCVNDSLAVLNQKCIHFYACIWAFASDIRFTEEFIGFLKLIMCMDDFQKMLPIHTSLKKSIGNGAKYYLNSMNLKKFKSHDGKELTTFNTESYINKNFEHESKQALQKSHNIKILPKSNAQNNNYLYLNESHSSVSFIEWLASITEQINQTLHHKQNESIETLQFYIHLRFFQLLEEKIHNTGKELNCAFISNRSKEISYQIYNIQHLKAILDTPQVSLKIMELLAHNKQEVFTKLLDQESHNIVGGQVNMSQKRYITFLKMGSMKSENINVPFTVIWNSSILPISNFGKLELTFHIGFCEAVTTV